MNDDEVEPSRLLAGKRGPSILEKEEMFERIAARVAAETHPRRRPVVPWAVALSAAALLGGLLLALRAGDLRRGEREPAEPEFGARGAAEPGLQLRCSPAPCARGGRLLLRVTPPEGKLHVAVFARASDGGILWYAPPPDGRMAAVRAGEWLPEAVMLNEAHRPGTYVVYAAFSAEPLTREALKAELSEGLRTTSRVTLVERTLAIGNGP